MTDQEILNKLTNGLKRVREILQNKFDNPHDKQQLPHIKLSEDIYKFDTGTGVKKASIQQKIKILMCINQNLQEFLNRFMKPRISKLHDKNPHAFVQQITLLSSHYLRLIYCYDFVLNKLSKFCISFYKIEDNYRALLKNQILGSVPVMGGYQLFNFIKSYQPLVKNFARVFCNFIIEQRLNKVVPRENIKDSMTFFQACYLNHQASIERKQQRITLVKKINKQIPVKYKANDQSFLEKQFQPILLQSISFYDQFVRIRASNLSATQQIALMKNIIQQEESRSFYYINNQKSRAKYLKRVDEVLIEQNIQIRVNKADGLKKYLSEFKIGAKDAPAAYQDQLKTFWFVYKRVLHVALPIIKNIYYQYLKEEGASSKTKIQEAKAFIEDIIRINQKNNAILDIFDKNFDLKNLQKNVLTRILSNNLIQDKTTKVVNFKGAKNLAQFIHGKFKMLYRQSNNFSLISETLAQITAIFKTLTQKDTFLKEHQKTTAIRLSQQIDFSDQDQVHRILNLQQKFIAQIRNELGFSQIKNLSESIINLKMSLQQTKRVRDIIGNKQFNQILIKTSAFWPEEVSYEIQNPPNVLLPMMVSIKQAILKKGQIKFQLTNGMSSFLGLYKKSGTQKFNIKNVYLVVLLFIDQADGKKIKFGDLKMKMRNTNNQSRKKARSNQLQRTIIELLHSGLIRSPNKEIKQGQKDVAKVVQSDEFSLNIDFDFVVQQKRQGRPANMITKMKCIMNSQLTILPRWLEAAFKQQLNEQKLDEEQYELYRKNKVKGELRKMLKHAHNQNKYCNFEDFMKNCSKIKEYPVNHRFLKEMIEILINEGVCERVQQQRNTYRYIH